MNRETFTQLVRKELPGLRRFLLAACSGNSDEADDVAQEALMKAYVASRHFEDEEGFSAWLYTSYEDIANEIEHSGRQLEDAIAQL